MLQQVVRVLVYRPFAKYHKPVIRPMNNQGEIVNRPSQIYFDGEVKDDYFDIKIGGQSFVASGNGKSQIRTNKRELQEKI
jgi:hypothetical protein